MITELTAGQRHRRELAGFRFMTHCFKVLGRQQTQAEHMARECVGAYRYWSRKGVEADWLFTKEHAEKIHVAAHASDPLVDAATCAEINYGFTPNTAQSPSWRTILNRIRLGLPAFTQEAFTQAEANRRRLLLRRMRNEGLTTVEAVEARTKDRRGRDRRFVKLPVVTGKGRDALEGKIQVPGVTI